MIFDWSHLRVSDGVSQKERLPSAFSNGYIKPQERTLADHLTLASRLSELVQLPGAEGQGVQNWSLMFQAEPAIVMAEIISVKLDERRLAFEAALDSDPARAMTLLKDRANQIRRIRADLIRFGYRPMADIMDNVGDALRTSELLELAEAASGMTAGEVAEKLQLMTEAVPASDVVEQARAARHILSNAHEHFVTVIKAVRPRAQRAFEERLKSGLVDPSIGLLVSQFTLLEKAENRANRFPDRHIEYYYRNILGQKPNHAIPETVLLRFVPAAAQTIVPSESIVLGTVPGTEITKRYRILDPVRVVPANVADSRILVFDRDPAISNQQSLGFVTGVRATTRDLDGGEKSERVFAHTDGDEVELGLDLQSNIFMLSEGRREITVTISMAERVEIDLPQRLVAENSEEDDAEPDTVQVSDDTTVRPKQRFPARMKEAIYSAIQSDKTSAVAFGTDRNATVFERIADRVTKLVETAEDAPDVRQLFYQAALEHSETASQVRAIYGRLVADTLISGAEWPTGYLKDLIVQKMRAYPTSEVDPIRGVRHYTTDQDAAADVLEWFARRPLDIFQEFLNGAFSVTLSTAEGPFQMQTARAVPNKKEDGPGFTLRMVLDEASPVIIGPEEDQAPIMQIRMEDGSFFCPYSLFERYAIEKVTTNVKVSGLTRLTGFSDDGFLDLSQPFMPFGVQPRHRSSFQVGSREMALKPVTWFAVDLEWAGLPRGAGGFFDHYAAYSDDFDVPNPQLAASYLTSEGWKILDQTSVPMTVSKTGHVGLNPDRRIERSIPGRATAARSGTSEIDFLQRNRIRAGLVQLELDCKGAAFGHGTYPLEMSRALRPSLIPFRRREVPEQPYTPEISRITLDYIAEEVIEIDAPGAARADQKIVQVSPFGQTEIYPKRNAPRAGIFPQRIANGSLFLQLAGDGLGDTVSILFEMEKSSHKRVSFAPPGLRWIYLSTAGWKDLPSWGIASDSTDGLMRSGVLRVTLPDDVAMQSNEMPGHGVWLGLTVDTHLADFPKLQSVSMNGARAVRAEKEEDPTDAEQIPVDWFLEDTQTGIAAIERVGNSVDGAPAEEKNRFRERVSERLRHRKRGVMPWDIERLALSEFPEIWKAKCFRTLDKKTDKPVPGAVTLIAVPHPPEDAQDNPSLPRMFDVLTLRRIQDALQPMCSSFAKLEVSNPSYERLQVRARVGFKAGRDDGSLMQRLKLDVSRYLSVWCAPAPMDGFGWNIHLNDVGAYIANLDYVDFFSELSLLQLVADDGERYDLIDTARASAGQVVSPDLSHHTPWALPLPMPDQWIVQTREKAFDQAGPTGIGGLVVGQNLVIDRG